MTGLEGARCAGRWWLFDSTDRRDHIAARQLCSECPAIAGCRELLQEALTAPCVQAGSGPIGTWAGLLFGRVGQNRPRVKSAQVRRPIRTPVRVESGIKRGPDRANESDPLTADSILETNGGYRHYA